MCVGRMSAVRQPRLFTCVNERCGSESVRALDIMVGTLSGVDGCVVAKEIWRPKAKNIGADDLKIRQGCRVGCDSRRRCTTFRTAYPPDQHVRQ